MPNPTTPDFPPRLCFDKTGTIANGQTKTEAIDLNGTTLCGLFVPANFTGTALTFEASIDGATFVQLYSAGSAYSVTVAASKYIALDPSIFAGVRFLKIVSGSTESGGDTITLATRPV